MSEGRRVAIVLCANIAAIADIALSTNQWFIVTLVGVMALVNSIEIIRAAHRAPRR